MVDPIKKHGIYRISVHDRESGKLLQTGFCKVGEWKEIGPWLDNFGYIDTEYEIRITVEIPL